MKVEGIKEVDLGKEPLSFRTEVFGKCIVVGEHAVLRGKPALLVPYNAQKLTLTFEPNDKADLQIDSSGDLESQARLVFFGVFEKALSLVSKSRREFSGHVDISNSIPVGGGLGASAALCVAVTRLFYSRGWIGFFDQHEFARELENLFHGESSGADIAVALKNSPIEFVRGRTPLPLKFLWKPTWYLSFTGKRGVTSECISQVKGLWTKYPERAKMLDDQMGESVALAKKALGSSKELGLPILADALNLAEKCFEGWGLIDPNTQNSIERLRSSGAIAVKPTGSGGGGHLLSLWPQPPSASVITSLQLLPL